MASHNAVKINIQDTSDVKSKDLAPEFKLEQPPPSKNHLTWLSILFKHLDFDTDIAAATLILGTIDNQRPYGIRVNESPIEPILRRSSHRLTYDVKIPFKKREVFSTFPHVIDEYSCLIELTSIEVQMPDGERVISRPVLACPKNATVSYVVDFHEKFLTPFIPGSMLVSLEEEKSASTTYVPRFKVRVLKKQSAFIPAVRFYTPICGMTFGLVFSREAFNDPDNFYSAVLAIVMTLTIAYRDLVRENDTGELILFNVVLLMFFASLIPHGDDGISNTAFERCISFGPLSSLLFVIFSWFVTSRWTKIMCVNHDEKIRASRGDEKTFKSTRKALNMKKSTELQLVSLSEEFAKRDMLVKEDYILNIKDGEVNSLFPSYSGRMNDYS